MAGVTIKWIGGGQFMASDEAGHTIVTDSDGQQGFKPPELLLAALVGCAGVDVVSILEKKRKTITDIQVRVGKQNAPEPPWTIEKIDIEWVISGPNLTQKAAEDAVRLSQEKYCSVAASLKSELVTTLSVVTEE